MIQLCSHPPLATAHSSISAITLSVDNFNQNSLIQLSYVKGHYCCMLDNVNRLDSGTRPLFGRKWSGNKDGLVGAAITLLLHDHANFTQLPNVCSRAPPKKAQLRAPLSPLQIAWTGFDPNLYSGGSSSAGPALVEIATARSFILNRWPSG